MEALGASPGDMKRAVSLLLLACWCSCSPEPDLAPADRMPLTHLVDRPADLVQLAGTVTELGTACSVELEDLMPQKVGEDLWVVMLPWDPAPGTLEVQDERGTGLSARAQLRDLLDQDGFALQPTCRRYRAAELVRSGGETIAPSFEGPYERGFFRFSTPAATLTHGFTSFLESTSLRLSLRGEAGAELAVVVDGVEVDRVLAADTWETHSVELSLTDGRHRLSLRSKGGEPVRIDVAEIELEHEGGPLLVARHGRGGPWKASYTARRPGERERLWLPSGEGSFWFPAVGGPVTVKASAPGYLAPETASTNRRGETTVLPAGRSDWIHRNVQGWIEIEQPWARLLGEGEDPEQRLFTHELPPPIPAHARRVLARTDLGGDRRAGLWLPVPSSAEFRVEAGAATHLRTSVGVDGEGEALFRITWIQADEELVLDAVRREGGPWLDRDIPLPPSVRGTGILRFETLGEVPLSATFADPRLIASPSKVDRPNVLVYLIDTLRADHLSCYGASNPTSPHLDRLAAEGFFFTDFSAVASWTRPTTATVLTGYYPDWHGMGRESPLPTSLETLAESFAKAGYSTWAAVANVQVAGKGLCFEQGFHRFVDNTGIGADVEQRAAQASSRLLNATAFPWLREHGDEPFFLYLHSLDPHTPYAPPPQAASPFGRDYEGPLREVSLRRATLLEQAELDPADVQYVRDVYDNEIHYQDTQIGELLALLEELELDGNTIVVILSDHGEEFGEHGDWNHGYRMWEELLRVPLIVWLPEPLRRKMDLSPRRIDASVSQVDFLPGLLELAGVRDGFPRQGRSWFPLLRGSEAGLLPYFGEDYQTWEGDEIGAFRRDGHKLIWNVDHGAGSVREMLFDLKQDPGETNDLAETETSLLERLRHERDALGAQAARVRSRLVEAGYPHVLPADAEAAPKVRLDRRAMQELQALGYLGDD